MWPVSYFRKLPLSEKVVSVQAKVKPIDDVLDTVLPKLKPTKLQTKNQSLHNNFFIFFKIILIL